METNNAFKNYFREKNYAKCTSILKNKITNYVVSQIQEIDPTFDFTTVTDLIIASDFYLKNSLIANKLKLALNQEELLEQIQSLLSICEIYAIKN